MRVNVVELASFTNNVTLFIWDYKIINCVKSIDIIILIYLIRRIYNTINKNKNAIFSMGMCKYCYLRCSKTIFNWKWFLVFLLKIVCLHFSVGMTFLVLFFLVTFLNDVK